MTGASTISFVAGRRWLAFMESGTSARRLADALEIEARTEDC